jgi:serine O-acetyltransferase
VRDELDQREAWRSDRRRYPPHAFVRDWSIYAIAIYRLGRWNDQRPSSLRRYLLDRIYWAAFRVVELLTGVSFSKQTEIGPGLRIHHFGNIFVNERSHIGSNCTLRQGVTIGTLTDDGLAPTIGDDVDIGAYAQVLGGVHVGDGARIGAMSVVLDDVPPGATAVGVPARIIERVNGRGREQGEHARSVPASPRRSSRTPNPSR